VVNDYLLEIFSLRRAFAGEGFFMGEVRSDMPQA
jgi:hypothetical protein